MKKNRYQIEYNLVTMNIFGTIYTILLSIGTFFLIKTPLGNNFGDIGGNLILDMSIIFIMYLFWICLHEAIHGLFYCIGGAKWKDISFGAALEKGILYCKCSNLITKKNAMISLQAPLVIIGIITYIISFLTGSYALLILSIANIYGACGDIVVFNFFMHLDRDTMFKEIGDTSTFMLVTKEDLTKRKYFGIKKIIPLKEGELEEKENKKIKISKESITIIIILLIIIILDIILALLEGWYYDI